MAAVSASPAGLGRGRPGIDRPGASRHGFWSGEMIRSPEAAAEMALMALILLIVNGDEPDPAG